MLRSKFVEDLRESIAEMDEMESLRIEAELEKQHVSARVSTSSHDTKRVAVGCTEFLQILALSEMNADTLVGAAFHYASSVDTLLTNRCEGGCVIQEF